MKNTFLFLALYVTIHGHSQTLTATQASSKPGQKITVCAKVVGTHVTKGKIKVIYLNLEKPYPNSPFTLVIFEKSADRFHYNPLDFLKNKFICASGIVSEFKGKSQMVVDSQEQIEVVK
jgi:hypothetical protein